MIFFTFDLTVEKKLEFRVCHNGRSGVNTVNKRNVLFELKLGFGVAFLAVLFAVFIKNRKKAVGFVGGTDKFVIDIKAVTFVNALSGVFKNDVRKVFRVGKFKAAYRNDGKLRSEVSDICGFGKASVSDDLFGFIINAFACDISKIFSVGVKCKSVFKSTEILESNNKKNSCANGGKIVENGTEYLPDKNSPAFNKVFKCGDLFVFTAFLGAFKYFKRIRGSVAVR